LIAITKELKQIIREIFTSRGVTEIPAVDLVDILDVTIEELQEALQDAELNNEFKITQAKNGDLYIKRTLPDTGGKMMIGSLNIQWDNLGGCPCFTCGELDRCDIGNPISSVDCPLFSKWLFPKPDMESEKEE
jgi:hypothetical protein